MPESSLEGGGASDDLSERNGKTRTRMTKVMVVRKQNPPLRCSPECGGGRELRHQSICPRYDRISGTCD